ncbi:MAG: class B sortase [Lachnospiraceae bacterium]|nr:class B sortase [Lachnospiraceae bacterium]
MKKTGFKICFTICLVAFFLICTFLAYRYITRKNAERKMEEIVEEANAAPTELPSPTLVPTVPATKVPTPTETPVPTPTRDPLAERGVTIPEKNIDWEGLWSENPDIYAWIYIPGTNVDYPILQHPEEKSYYLDHNIDHSEGYPGCIYTQNVNAKDWNDPNTVIYGHSMKDGSMFHDLHKFEDNAFFDETQFMFIYTPEGNKAYEIFAAYPFSNVDLMMCFDYSTPDAVLLYFDGIWTNRDMSSHFRDSVTLYGDSKIITMSTCIGGEPNMRYLVQAVLLNP